MAYHAKNTEHAGDKGSGRKSGYWGKRADAKHESSRRRRIHDREAVVQEYLEHTDAGDECDYGQKRAPKPICDEYKEMIDRIVAAYQEVFGARDDLALEEKERLLEPIRCFQSGVEEAYRAGRE